MCLLKEVTMKVNRCVSERRGWERAVFVGKRQALPTGPGGLAGRGLLAAERWRRNNPSRFILFFFFCGSCLMGRTDAP